MFSLTLMNFQATRKTHIQQKLAALTVTQVQLCTISLQTANHFHSTSFKKL